MSKPLVSRYIYLGCYFFCVALPLTACVSADTGPISQEILQRVDAYRGPSEQFTMSLRLTSFEGSAIAETALFDVYVSGKDKTLVVARKYRTQDMRILYVEDNMWVHVPNSRRPIRITPIQRLIGQASNGDVVEVSYSQNYMAENAGLDTLSGVPCLRLRLEAKRKSATYKTIVLWVRQDDDRPVKAEFYLVSRKQLKTAYFEKYAEIRGKPILTQMTIYDEVRKQSRTTFEYSHIEPRILPAKYFNKDYLVHVRGL